MNTVGTLGSNGSPAAASAGAAGTSAAPTATSAESPNAAAPRHRSCGRGRLREVRVRRSVPVMPAPILMSLPSASLDARQEASGCERTLTSGRRQTTADGGSYASHLTQGERAAHSDGAQWPHFDLPTGVKIGGGDRSGEEMRGAVLVHRTLSTPRARLDACPSSRSPARRVPRTVFARRPRCGNGCGSSCTRARTGGPVCGARSRTARSPAARRHGTRPRLERGGGLLRHSPLLA